MNTGHDRGDTLAIVVDTVSAFVPRGVVVDADTQLLERGLLDSVGMVNILLELEARLGITLTPADLAFDHFRDCRLLAARLAERSLV